MRNYTASFERGPGFDRSGAGRWHHWRPVDHESDVSMGVNDDGGPGVGHYLWCSTATVLGSVGYDFEASPASVAVMAWVRCGTPNETVRGNLVIQELSNPPWDATRNVFEVDNTWTMVSHTKDLYGIGEGLRVYFSLQTVNVRLDVDRVWIL